MDQDWKPPLASATLYDVAILTALSKERAAVLYMLDEIHEEPAKFSQGNGDNNSYSWGRIGKHNVVIASLEEGVYGTVSAAGTANGIVTSLPHIRLGIFVGIGAGLPGSPAEKDIRVGDVVVSQPQGTIGGVVQYDLGKFKIDEEGKRVFERVGQLNAPPAALLTAVGALKAQHKTPFRRRMDQYMQVFNQYPEGVAFRHPGFDKDTWKDVWARLFGGERRAVIHYGIIASGDRLVKDTAERDDIVATLEYQGIRPLCIEMEAAGVMNKFPCLVVRGICDYADDLKNDDWQEHAAAIAAAYTKELLTYVKTTEVKDAKTAGDLAQPPTNIKHTGTGNINTNYGGNQTVLSQSGSNNKQFNGGTFTNF